jgi:WhiB family redox-sensing transcriptional regulator
MRYSQNFLDSPGGGQEESGLAGAYQLSRLGRSEGESDEAQGCALSPVKNMVWKQLAACRGVEPEIFYPVTDEEAEEAKAICAACPVREMCLDFALGNRERDGVWGGATERERRRILRQRRKSA